MMFSPDDQIEFWVCDDWTVVYLNGQMIHAGDSYLADEWLQEYVGVKVVNDERKLSLPDGRNPVRTLAELRVIQEQANARAALAAEKRQQAQALLAEAMELDV
jgi:hypothetical protein